MIIHNLNVCWPFRSPTKAKSKLVVDADTVLTISIVLQHLQPVAGRRAKKVERVCRIKLGKFPGRNVQNTGKSFRFSSFKKRSRIRTTEPLYHEKVYNV